MTRRINDALLVISLVLTTQVAGQESDSAAGAGADGVSEEIVVIGQSRARLRVQIELAEEALYQRFNDINSNDEFDIHCRRQSRPGTRIPIRICQANFWREAQSNAAEATVRALQGSAAVGAQVFQGEAMYKSRLLEDEMRALAAQDEQLMASLVRLAGLQESLSNVGNRRRQQEATRARIATASAQTQLPYDARVVADVQIERDPWEHVLTHQTFAVAYVYGVIDTIRLNCQQFSGQLSFEHGAEWSIPDDSAPCWVAVEADRGTTFSFFEFD
jgi:hypothetical protein